MGDIAYYLMENGYDGKYDRGYASEYSPRITCRRCGACGLVWGVAPVSNERRLFHPNGAEHVCRYLLNPEDDFDVIDS